MSSFDKFITKDGSKFYLDLDEYEQKNGIVLESGDIIKFSYEKKRYLAKIDCRKNGVAEVIITKEIIL
jgi:hypothetical protein